MNAAHQIKIGVAEKQRHEFIFFHAHAVFAGQRATQLDAIAEDFMGGGDGVFKLPRIARIVENDGMQVAVAGMEDIADGEAVLLADPRESAAGPAEAWSGG